MSAYQNYSNAGQGYVQDSFSSDNTGGPKKQSNHTLRPVTIKQLMSVQQTQADGDFRIDNASLGSVTLIGCVRNVNKQSTHQTFQIEDGTGTIDAKRFPSEDEDPAEIAAVDIGTYVRVVGVLKQLNSRFMLTIFSIRPIQNFDELTYHTLEVIYVHASATKSKSSRLGGMNTGMGMSSSVGQYNNPYTHHNAGASGSDDFVANKILETIRSNPGNQEGVHRDMIIRPVAAATGADPQTVGDLIEGMIRDGFLYTGEDENHILAMEE